MKKSTSSKKEMEMETEMEPEITTTTQLEPKQMENESKFFRDEVQELKQQLLELQAREQKSINAKVLLESELSQLHKSYDSKSKSFTKFDSELKRMKELLHEEQNKCFDLQQTIAALKNQIAKANQQAETWKTKFQQLELRQQVQEKKHQKRINQKNKKTSTSTTLVEPEIEIKSDVNSVWHAAHHERDYTEMVGKAQQEQQEFKSFSEVVKESIQKDEIPSTSISSQAEFIVIGGPQSSKHVVEPIKEEESIVETVKPEMEHSKSVWKIPDHTSDFTQLVAKAQMEEINHPKLADVIKEKSLQDSTSLSSKASSEFTVVGGDLSSKHISAN